MKINYEFHQFAEFWNICHKKIKENICMKIDFTSLSCLKNQRNQNWICQLLRVSRNTHTHVSEEKNKTAKVKIDLDFLGFLEKRQLSCQYRVHFARLRETRVTFVIPMLNHFDHNVWRWPN